MLEVKMAISVRFWYPNTKLEKIVEDAQHTFIQLESTLYFLNGLGLHVIVPKDFIINRELYVDTCYFKQR